MKFVAFARSKQGTGASRRLRNTGRAPGIVFGGASEPSTIELDHNALWFALQKEAFHSSILEMELEGKTEKVLFLSTFYEEKYPDFCTFFQKKCTNFGPIFGPFFGLFSPHPENR